MQEPVAVLTVILEGQVIAGGCVSFTVTLKVQVAVRPPASVAVNVLTVVPTGKVAPLARPAVCTVVTPGQLSIATGVV